MTVRYVRVRTEADMFAPVVRANGNVALVGKITPPAANPPADLLAVGKPVDFTDPAEAKRRAPGELGASIAEAFAQSPGPTVVYGVRVDTTNPNYAEALDALGAENVQIVAIAATPLNATTGAANGAIDLLCKHVVAMSGESGGSGKERIGVAMLAKGSADPAVLTGSLAEERMVYIAHKSDEDAAAAVAGTIAGYEPHISMLLKQVTIDSAPFSPAEIRKLNGDEDFKTGPAGKGVNWLTRSELIPGPGVYLGEGYTGNPNKKKYIDVVRTMDSVSFQLKARLIRAIGRLRISRAGLRAVVAQLETVLEPLVAAEVIDDYEVVIPLLALLDKDPDTLTQSEGDRINAARSERVVEVLTLVTYAAAIHRLSISLKFE